MYNTSKFEISLSVRLAHDAHIFLCEKDYPPASRCYWILLGFNKGWLSGFRKCDVGYINSTVGYPQEPCKRVYNEVSAIMVYLIKKIYYKLE